MEADILPPSQPGDDLAELVSSLNEKLEASAEKSVNSAFNLGCSVSLLPIGLLVALVFIFSRLNWVVTFVAAVVGLILALGLATLAATTARGHNLERTYELYVEPGIERYIAAAQITRAEFDRQAAQALPPGAKLRRFLSVPAEVDLEALE